MRQHGPCGFAVRMKDALNSQSFRDLNELRGIVDEDSLRGLHLSYIESHLEDIRAGLRM